MSQGYKLLKARRQAEACDRWLEAWELVKQLARPEWQTAEQLDQAHRRSVEYVFNWCQDLEAELDNAGTKDPRYHEHWLRYAREFMERFPGEDANHYVNFMRAQGEALWDLGRQTEAEAVYSLLVEKYPDEAWGYIGWADRYWLFQDSPKEYGRAEEIMKLALARPALNERDDLLERLEELHSKWGKHAEETPVSPMHVETALPDVSEWLPGFRALLTRPGTSPPVPRKRGRNAPRWCGSGKKYKKCHLQADENAQQI